MCDYCNVFYRSHLTKAVVSPTPSTETSFSLPTTLSLMMVQYVKRFRGLQDASSLQGLIGGQAQSVSLRPRSLSVFAAAKREKGRSFALDLAAGAKERRRGVGEQHVCRA